MPQVLQDFVRTEYTEAEKEQNRKKEHEQAFLEESGLEGMEVDKLRRTMLSSAEAIAAKTEQMDDIRARKCRKADWQEYVDHKRRWGRALHHSDFIRHLRCLIPNLYAEDGRIRNTISLYIWDRTEPFLGKVGGTVFLGWCHVGPNPEYELDIVNDVGIAVGQKRGWRTTIMRMICRRDKVTYFPKSLFSESQAYEEFGYPTQGNTSYNYRANLYEFRHTSPDRAKLNHMLQELAQKYKYS